MRTRKLCLFFLIFLLAGSVATGCNTKETNVSESEKNNEQGADLVGQKAPGIEWIKNIGGSHSDLIRSIQQTIDGGYIAVGDSNSNDGDIAKNNGNSDIWIAKMDGKGEISWNRSMGGTLNDYAYCVQQTSEGGFILAGYTHSNNGDVSGNHGGADAWIVKLNSSGTVSWRKCLGGNRDDYAYSIRQTSDGGYIVAGSSYSNSGALTGNHGEGDAWVTKLDSSGSVSWSKSLGGNGDDYVKGIQQTSDGGYIAAGSSYSNSDDVTGNHGEYDVWVFKLDSRGVMSWSKSFGGDGDDYANDIQKTSEGGYIVSGNSESLDGDIPGNHGLVDGWVLKLDESGLISWTRNLGGSGNDYVNEINNTGDGGYIIAGNSSSNDGDVTGNYGMDDGWIAKLDSSGAISWTKCLGGSEKDFCTSIQKTSDGGYAAAVYSFSNDCDILGNHGDYDICIIKLK